MSSKSQAREMERGGILFFLRMRSGGLCTERLKKGGWIELPLTNFQIYNLFFLSFFYN